MPIYTYQCTACGQTTEKRQGFHDAALTTCEVCQGALRRVIHPVGIVFKGSGWYVTDSRSAASNGAAEKPAKDEAAEPAGDAASSGPEAGAGAAAPAAGEKAESPKAKPAAGADKPAGKETSGPVAKPTSASPAD